MSKTCSAKDLALLRAPPDFQTFHRHLTVPPALTADMYIVHIRGDVPGGAMAPQDFCRSVNPISTRGTDYAHLITTGTPGFSDLPTALFLSRVHFSTPIY